MTKVSVTSNIDILAMKPLDAAEFLSLIWPQSLLRNETLELRAIKRSDKTISRRHLKSQAEFLKTARAFGAGWDIYFAVCTRYENGGKKADCMRVNCVWVDFDNVKELPSFGKHKPDLMVNSGGGFHVYWLLTSPVFVRTGRWQEIEAINRGLTKKFNQHVRPVDPSKKFGGDIMTIDITRILRVPDFYNYKYTPARKVEAYALQD